MSNANNRLIQPGAVNVAATFQPGPLAAPVAVTLQGPQGVHVMAVGGLTKVEQLAALVCSADLCDSVHDTAKEAVDLAEAILAECERREKEKAANGT